LFDHAEGLKVTTVRIEEFEIAGEDRRFRATDAKIGGRDRGGDERRGT
jgi:hypothetical protein